MIIYCNKVIYFEKSFGQNRGLLIGPTYFKAIYLLLQKKKTITRKYSNAIIPVIKWFFMYQD